MFCDAERQRSGARNAQVLRLLSSRCARRKTALGIRLVVPGTMNGTLFQTDPLLPRSQRFAIRLESKLLLSRVGRGYRDRRRSGSDVHDFARAGVVELLASFFFDGLVIGMERIDL